jgi:hypothetical protein
MEDGERGAERFFEEALSDVVDAPGLPYVVCHSCVDLSSSSTGYPSMTLLCCADLAVHAFLRLPHFRCMVLGVAFFLCRARFLAMLHPPGVLFMLVMTCPFFLFCHEFLLDWLCV